MRFTVTIEQTEWFTVESQAGGGSMMIVQCEECHRMFHTNNPAQWLCDECEANYIDLEYDLIEEQEETDELIYSPIEEWINQRCPDCGQSIHGEFGCVCS